VVKMPSVKTGPVRVSGYALKVRRVINAALREYYKDKRLDPKEINALISDLNTKIYNVMVERFQLPKEAIVNISIDYDIVDNKFIINNVNIEVYDLSEILTKNITNEVKKLLTTTQ